MSECLKKILVLCTGNSCRSIMLEGLLGFYGKDFYQVFSAGSNPTGKIHPLSIEVLENESIPTYNFHSKSWNELSDKNFDLVITVCDNAAKESCPIYLSSASKCHWGVEDPAKFLGSEIEIKQEFIRVFSILKKRTMSFLNQDINILNDNDELQKIGRIN